MPSGHGSSCSTPADIVEIHTGDPDWDAALAFGQKDALGAFFPGGQHLPQAVFCALPRPGQRIQPQGRWFRLLDLLERAVPA